MATSGLYGNSGTGSLIAQPGSETSGLYGNTVNFGGTVFEWFIFRESSTQPATPTGGSWNFVTNVGTPPAGWTASPPTAPTNEIWVSIAFINSRVPATIVWSTPGLLGVVPSTTVGATTTGAAGSSASVTNSGTLIDPILNFTIPQGATGATGATGPQGPQGNTGSAATIAAGTTTTGAAGSNASVVNSGTSSAAVFDFTIPRGNTGATGATGTAATITAGTTTTTAPGTNATVTNSGTSAAAIFDFGIPRGAGVVAGGTAGQYLAKASSTDYDTVWSTITGTLAYQGVWNASTNTPTLTSSVGTNGYYYVVSVAGSTNLNGVTDWQVGDWAIFNGSIWQKLDQTDLVTSVAGRTGAVVLANTDISGLGTMSTQNANSVAITGGTINGTTIGATTAATGAFTTVTASTSLTTPTVQAANSGGLSLKNSAGTTQLSMGGGGGDNLSLNVSTNINGTNAQIDISPTGTGHVHIKPTGVNSIEIAPTSVGKMDNMTIGSITPAAGTFTALTATGTTTLANGAILGTPASGTVTNLTGTASININGTVGATTASTGAFTTLTASADSTFSSTGALTISKGTTGQRPTATSGMLRFNTTSTEFEGYNGTTWASVGGAALSNDTSTATNVFPLFANATTGTASTLFTSNAKLLYKPSTGDLSATAMVSNNGITINADSVASNYTIQTGNNGFSVGPLTINNGVTITISSGQRHVII